MRTKFLIYALIFLFALPCSMRAEEVEIPLMKVMGMEHVGEVQPLDDAGQHGEGTHIDPTSFRATINGQTLSITKRESTIPSARARVVKATTGNIVLNEQFVDSLSEQISESGVYVLNIETDGGTLVGRFIVQ